MADQPTEASVDPTQDEATQVRVIEERFGAYQNLSEVDDSANQKLDKLVLQLKSDQRDYVVRLVASYYLEQNTSDFFQLETKQ